MLSFFWDLASLEHVREALLCYQPGSAANPWARALTSRSFLTSGVQDAREKAATALVDELLKSQAEEGESEEEEEAEAEAEATGQGRGQEVARALRRCTPLTVYAVKRLCRGLASGRQGARQGFALGLTTLLARSDCLSPEEAVTVLTGVLATGTKASPPSRCCCCRRRWQGLAPGGLP